MSESIAGRQRAEDTIRRLPDAMRAIERGDREGLRQAVAEVWHEDCEWFPLIGGVEGETSYRGHDGIVQFSEDLANAFEVQYGDQEVRFVGDAVVGLMSMHLRGRGSGVEINTELGVVYEIEDELIRRGWAYDSHAAALAAAEALHA
jgi:hypothetical protein